MMFRFDRVFIVTYGRSGSTLLQGLLNAIPGYRIYGENAGFMFKLQDSYEALLSAHKHLANPKNDNESQPWFGSSRFDTESVTREFRKFVNTMLFRPHLDPPHKVFGFKEIRFNNMQHENIDKYIQFMRRLFPETAIIFNTRKIEDVVKSGWWRNSYWSGLPAQLAEFHEFCGYYSEKNPDHAIHVTYDDLILADRKEVRRLLDFLGASLGEEAIDAVFRGNHSYANRTITAYMNGRVEHVTIEQPDWWRQKHRRISYRARPNAFGLWLVWCGPAGDRVERSIVRRGRRGADGVGRNSFDAQTGGPIHREPGGGPGGVRNRNATGRVDAPVRHVRRRGGGRRRGRSPRQRRLTAAIECGGR